MEKKNVLCIDDSPIMLRNLLSILKDDYAVALATSCEQGLFHMAKNIPDVILLDCEMPECDGRETYARIREVEEYRSIPIIFLTGVTDEAYIASIMELEPAGYLLKPAGKEAVISAIEKVI